MTIAQERTKKKPLRLETVTWNDLTWVNIEGPTEQETEYLAQNTECVLLHCGPSFS